MDEEGFDRKILEHGSSSWVLSGTSRGNGLLPLFTDTLLGKSRECFSVNHYKGKAVQFKEKVLHLEELKGLLQQVCDLVD